MVAPELSSSFGVNTVYSPDPQFNTTSVCAHVYTLNPRLVCVCVCVSVFRAMRAVPMHPEF